MKIEYTSAYPDPNVVIPQFEPHFHAFAELIDAGVATGRGIINDAAARGMHLSRSWKSHTLTECVVNAGKRRFTGGSGIRYLGVRSALELFQLGNIVFFFKKSKRGRLALAQNHPSEQQDEIRRANGLLEFPGGEYVVACVVYKTDASYTQLVEVSIACPKTYVENVWAHPFLSLVRGNLTIFPALARVRPETQIVPLVEIRKKEPGDGGPAS